MSKFINRLNDMFSHVEAEPPLYDTIYEYNGTRGEVKYKLSHLSGVNKPIQQEILIILSANMTNILDGINEQTPLTEDDITDLKYEIMKHSKNMVQNYRNDN